MPTEKSVRYHQHMSTDWCEGKQVLFGSITPTNQLTRCDPGWGTVDSEWPDDGINKAIRFS